MNRPSGKMLLLLELAVFLVFFCFSAAVCTYLFVAANQKTADADRLSRSVVEATSIAETLKTADGHLTKAAVFMGTADNAGISDGTLMLYYDEDFKPTDEKHSQYKAIVSKDTLSKCYSYIISIYDSSKNEKIYVLSFKTLRTGGGSNEIR